MLCTPVWRLGLSYAARERGLNFVKPLACRDSRLSYVARERGLKAVKPVACRDSRNSFVTASEAVP